MNIEVLQQFSYQFSLETVVKVLTELLQYPVLFDDYSQLQRERETSDSFLQFYSRYSRFIKSLEKIFLKEIKSLEVLERILLLFQLYHYFFREVSGSLKYNVLRQGEESQRIHADLKEVLQNHLDLFQPAVVFSLFQGTIKPEGIGLRCVDKEGEYQLNSSRMAGYFAAEESFYRDFQEKKEFLLYVVTIGEQLDRKVQEYSSGSDVYMGYLLNGLGAGAAELIAEDFTRYTADNIFKVEYDWMGRFSPGYSDWNLKEQRTIFELLKPERHIGVRLTDSYLMVPEKSTSGIMGVKGSKERSYD